MLFNKHQLERGQSKPIVCFLGELPRNAVHGISISNSINIELLEEKFLVLIVEEVFGMGNSWRYKLSKFIHLIYRSFLLVYYSLFFNIKYFYLTISLSRLGLLKTYLTLVLFNILNRNARVIIHVHRSDFVFSDKASKFKKFLFIRIIKRVSKVILISRGAQNKFYLEYGKSINVDILFNTVKLYEVDDVKSFSSDTTKIVFISNYFKEKGILLLLNAIQKFEHRVHLSCYGSHVDSNVSRQLAAFGLLRVMRNLK
jgi:glycosyltransferase involved in cell wall biosynthesis